MGTPQVADLDAWPLRRLAWSALAMLGLACCAGPQPQPVISATPSPAAAAEPDLAYPGCFIGQLAGQAGANRAAAATLHMEVFKKDGRYTGTGFVIRGSAAGSGHNRIITAGHVADDILQHGGMVEAVTSNGVRIGYLDLVARPEPQPAVVNGYRMKDNDIAVLEVRGFHPGGREAFDAIEGIDLAATRPDRIIQGEFSSPAGVAGGASGSPVLVGGAAIGVLITSMSSSADLDGDKLWEGKVRVMGGSPDVAGASAEVDLPTHSVSFAEPITHPEVLAALGAAGARPGRPGTDFPDTLITAMPKRACIAYRGSMHITSSSGWLARALSYGAAASRAARRS